MRLDYIRAGMILTEDIYDDYNNLLLEKGSILTDTYLFRLRQLGFQQLRILDPYAATLKAPEIIPAQLRQELSTCIQALLTLDWQQHQAQKLCFIYLHQIQTMVTEVIATLETKLSDVINLPVREPSTTEIKHSINVCLLAIITGIHLKMSASVLSELAIGALLHDIGKTALPEETTSNDLGLHATLGQKLLLAHKFNPIIVRIAAEHHEHPDGSGYPLGLSGKDIHPLSRIVAVADYFDLAIANEKKTCMSRQEIVESMLLKGNASFDLTTLRAFFQTIAVYPVGSLVKLNTGKLAYIIKNRARMPLRPLVELVDHSQLKIDLALQPDMMIEQIIAE